jgi:uncharacterized lipoprotein YddW (UPF0748 family)
MAVEVPAGRKQIERKPAELRAAWLQFRSLTTPDKIDAAVRRAEEGHINLIVANVYAQGLALYDSDFIDKHPLVEGDFNPLAYLVDQAHRRGIQVDAWFVNGPVEYKGKSKIMAQHPDWAIVGPDGQKMDWMNFARPDVRQFVSDLMWESVTRYGVDGVHFDFTRYPGPQWGFDPYSIQAFDATHDFKLEELRYADLPAYGYFRGDALVQPSSAQVLATFSNGTPAVTINKYGQGQVILLNWRATEREVGVDSEIMRRSIKSLLKEGGQVLNYRPEGELDDNAKQSLDDAANWLRDLGWPAREVSSQDITDLSPNSVVVVSYDYRISAEGAASMEKFVAQGGGLVFIDGPTRSMNQPINAKMIGMQKRGPHFEEWMMLLPQGNNPLIPSSERAADLAIAQARDEQWKQFRKQGIDALIQGVYRRVKAQYPQVDISVTVTSDQAAASQLSMQDWRAWLEGSYVDFIVPRGYVEIAEQLEPILAVWQPVMQKYQRVTLGISTSTGKHSQRSPKDPSQLLEEANRAHQAGSYGIMIWNLDYIDDEQLKALASGPFR